MNVTLTVNACALNSLKSGIMYNLTMVRAPFFVHDFLKFFSFFFTINSVFVLGPLMLKVYLMRKISKFRKSREVSGLIFELWLKKNFLRVDGFQICLM